jgi:hypothetical protein
MPKVPKVPKIMDVNHSIGKKELRFVVSRSHFFRSLKF